MKKSSGKGFRKRYQVEVTETFEKIIEVVAYSMEEAIEQVTQRYKEGEIILYSSDFIDFSVGMMR